MIDSILFDFDSNKLSGKKLLKDGINNILFSFSKILHIENDYFNDYYNSCFEYALTIIKLNKMLGIKTIIGFRPTIENQEVIAKVLMNIDNDIDIRIHIHIGKNNDINKKRVWIPPLNQSKYSWSFEDDYCNNNNPKLCETDLPIFHFDYPYHLQKYIDFLYNRHINFKGDYEIVTE